MSKKKKILLIVLAVVLVAGGICWRILPDRLTGGTLKLSENILQNFSLRKISEAIGNGSYKYDYKKQWEPWDWMPDCDLYDISTEAYDERVHGTVFIAVPRNPEDAVDEKVIVPLCADWMRPSLLYKDSDDEAKRNRSAFFVVVVGDTSYGSMMIGADGDSIKECKEIMESFLTKLMEY